MTDETEAYIATMADETEMYVAMLGHDVEHLIEMARDPEQHSAVLSQAGHVVYAATKLSALAAELINETKALGRAA